jgi:hypothetical protein
MSRRILSTIHKLGQEVSIKTRSETATNEFNNPVSSWEQTATAQCVRTYPNRNSQFESPGGSYNEDRALFIFARSEAPQSGSRIVYDGEKYEVKSPTKYDTHVAVFGEPVNQ